MPTTFTGLVCYVLTGPILMAAFFTVAAECGYVSSDPQGKHLLNASEMWSRDLRSIANATGLR